jgi:hypothetical protein
MISGQANRSSAAATRFASPGGARAAGYSGEHPIPRLQEVQREATEIGSAHLVP